MTTIKSLNITQPRETLCCRIFESLDNPTCRDIIFSEFQLSDPPVAIRLSSMRTYRLYFFTRQQNGNLQCHKSFEISQEALADRLSALSFKVTASLDTLTKVEICIDLETIIER